MSRNNRQNSGRPIVYTDGACSSNGQANARAGVGVYWGENHPDNVSQRHHGRQTNNSAEIRAATLACEQAANRGYSSVTVRTDSQFLTKSVNEWIPRWQSNGWKNSSGHDVVNRSDFEPLINVMDRIDVNFERVSAHSGIHGNERADSFARRGCNN